MALISSGESLCLKADTSFEVLNECFGVEVAAASKLINIVLLEHYAPRPARIPWL